MRKQIEVQGAVTLDDKELELVIAALEQYHLLLKPLNERHARVRSEVAQCLLRLRSARRVL